MSKKIQESFEEILIHLEGDEIVVKFVGNGMNLTENYFYRWIEADYFILTNDNLELIDQDKEKIKSDTLFLADSIKFSALYDRYKYLNSLNGGSSSLIWWSIVILS